MAKLPTPEETARQILSIFVHDFKSREGDVLRVASFLAVFSEKGLDTRDLPKGIEFAVEKEWIEQTSKGGLKLTTAGFEDA
jgi:hypothetical protein